MNLPSTPILLLYKVLYESELVVFHDPEKYKVEKYFNYGFIELEFHEVPEHFETLYVKSDAIFPLCILAYATIEKLIIMATLTHNDGNFNILKVLEDSGCKLDFRYCGDEIWYLNESRMWTIGKIINNI